MKLLQLQEAEDETIKDWLKKVGAYSGKFTVIKGKINLPKDSLFNAKSQDLKKIEYKFGTVGDFGVFDNRLTNFDNFPDKVQGSLSIAQNNFMSMVGMPEVGGEISARNNALGSFEGLPETAPHNLMLSHNAIKSFLHCPRRIEKAFSISHNYISSFEHAPEYVGGSVWMSENPIKSLKGIHKHFKHIGRNLDVGGCPITGGLMDVLLIDGLKGVLLSGGETESSPELEKAVEIINKYVGKGKVGMLACQEELIDNDLDDFAE